MWIKTPSEKLYETLSSFTAWKENFVADYYDNYSQLLIINFQPTKVEKTINPADTDF